jgi:hypothetical protein
MAGAMRLSLDCAIGLLAASGACPAPAAAGCAAPLTLAASGACPAPAAAGCAAPPALAASGAFD